MFYRGEGELVANKVFPQLEGDSISKFSNELTSEIERIAMNLIQERGWLQEKDIVAVVKQQLNVSEKITGTQIKRVIAELLPKYGLHRSRLNKELRDTFGIKDLHNSSIIIYKIKNK